MPPRSWGNRTAAFVAADGTYGQDYKFRSWCEQRRIGYVVAVPRSHTIPLSIDGDLTQMASSRRADYIVDRAPKQAWKQCFAGSGVKR